MRTVARMLVCLLTVAGLGACGNATPATPSTSTAPPGTSAPPSPGPTGTPGATATTVPWTSGPTTLTRTVTGGAAELFQIRSAAHPAEGYDRITFDFRSDLPGYEVKYVSQVIADGSGLPVDVPGRQHLQIIFRPAQAHDSSGTQAVTPRAMTLTYPMMRAYAITGDFEAVLTVVIGLDDVVGYRIGEIPGTPGRIYVDVAA
jgi:hypothetical protein